MRRASSRLRARLGGSEAIWAASASVSSEFAVGALPLMLKWLITSRGCAAVGAGVGFGVGGGVGAGVGTGGGGERGGDGGGGLGGFGGGDGGGGDGGEGGEGGGGDGIGLPAVQRGWGQCPSKHDHGAMVITSGLDETCMVNSCRSQAAREGA